MLFSVEQAFVGREEIRAPLKTPAWEAMHSLDRTQLIHMSIVLSFQFSVSLFINPVRCFQSHFKVKQIASYST